MVKFKRRVWGIFYALAILFTLLCIYLLNVKHNELMEELEQDQIRLTRLFNYELTIVFSQLDSISDLIAANYRLQNNNGVHAKLFNSLLEKTPIIDSIYLFSPSGQYIVSSGSPSDLHLNKKSTVKFLQSLKTNKMLIGEPIYIPAKKDWIIPIKKRVLDQKNNTIAVIDLHISTHDFLKMWRKNVKGLKLDVTSNNQRFLILNYNTSLQSTLDASEQQDTINYLKKRFANNELDQLRQQNEEAVLLSTKTSSSKTSVAVTFNKAHQLWVNTTYPFEIITQKITNLTVSYLLIYFYVLFIFWAAFKWIISLGHKSYLTLIYATEHDNLTKLYNRTTLSDRILKKQEAKEPFTLLYLNLINFKKINATFGYQYGDTILIEVANRITKSFEQHQGIVTHFSGDDFVILMEETERKIVTEYAKDLLTLIDKPYYHLHNSFTISASIGIVNVHKKFNYLHHTTLDSLINHAEKSMFLAVHNTPKYMFFSEDIYEDSRQLRRYEESLTAAIFNAELSLLYQPQVNSKGVIVGVEALLRWCNPQLGHVSPEIFIPIAEDLNIMHPLGKFVIETALTDFVQLQEKLQFHCSLSINVSAQQFLQQDFLSSLLESYACHASPYLELIVEITESVFIENIDQLLATFNVLRAHSIGLSLDDFGTGFSSLSMLKSLPIDELKVDKCFVDNIVTSKKEQSVLSKIVEIANTLNLKVVIEGVETADQLAILETINYDIVQGYYYSKPLKIDELEKFIIKNQTDQIT